MLQLLVVTVIGFNLLFIETTGFALGERKSLDIAGKHISIEHVPYTAAVFLGNKFICAASIIHEQFVLSAAQCFETNERKQKWKVLVGSHDLNSGGFLIEVEMVLCHHLYNNVYLDNDICLLKLNIPVPLGCFWNLDKVDLPSDPRQILEGTMVNVTGWEYIEINTKRQRVGNNLRQITIPIVSNECCKLVHSAMTNQICAGSNARDTCTGGGGGPMVYNGIQIGVISYSWSECAKYPAVYTKVADYVPWITKNIQRYKSLNLSGSTNIFL